MQLCPACLSPQNTGSEGIWLHAHLELQHLPAAEVLGSSGHLRLSLPEFGEMCKLLMSLARPLVLGLEIGAQADVARGGLFPGTFTVVLKRSISLPWTFCM